MRAHQAALFFAFLPALYTSPANKGWIHCCIWRIRSPSFHSFQSKQQRRFLQGLLQIPFATLASRVFQNFQILAYCFCPCGLFAKQPIPAFCKAACSQQNPSHRLDNALRLAYAYSAIVSLSLAIQKAGMLSWAAACLCLGDVYDGRKAL